MWVSYLLMVPIMTYLANYHENIERTYFTSSCIYTGEINHSWLFVSKNMINPKGFHYGEKQMPLFSNFHRSDIWKDHACFLKESNAKFWSVRLAWHRYWLDSMCLHNAWINWLKNEFCSQLLPCMLQRPSRSTVMA